MRPTHAHAVAVALLGLALGIASVPAVAGATVAGNRPGNNVRPSCRGCALHVGYI